MPQIHGRNSSVIIYDSAGASQALTADANNTTLAWSRNNPDVTTYGFDTTQRLAGMRDYTLTVAGIWNSGTGKIVDNLDNLMSGSIITTFRWMPSGSTQTGCPFYTGCALISAYQEAGPVNGPVTLTATFQAAAGSLTASTV